MLNFSVDLLKRHWFAEIGVSDLDFDDSSTLATEHGATLRGYSGALAFKHREKWVLSVPASIFADTKERVRGFAPEELFNRAGLSKFFEHSIDTIIGPAWIGQIAKLNFTPSHSTEVRRLKDSDWANFDKFLAEADLVEAEHSALVSGREPTAGVFHQNQIVAAASYELIEGCVAHVGVLVSKQMRGKGFGKQAISLITELALAKDLGIQYQTLMENVSSVAAAKSLGFEEFAETYAVRLKA